MFLAPSMAIGPIYESGRTAQAALINEATVLNDLTPTFTRGTQAFNPQNGSLAGHNLLLQSGWAGAVSGSPGTTPTSWSMPFSGGSITVSVGNLGGNNSVLFSVTAARHFFAQNLSVSASTVYQLSSRVISNSGLAVNQLVSWANLPAGATITWKINATSDAGTGVPVAGDLIVAVLTVAGTAGTADARVGAGVSTNTTGSAQLEGPQVEVGDRPGTYTPTTTAAASARRRWTFLAAGRSLLGDIVEGARTNLLLRSQEFNDTTWTSTGFAISVTTDATAAPDGTTTADKLIATAVNSFHYVRQTITKAASSLRYVLSVYLKQGEYRYGVIQMTDGANGVNSRVDLQTGAVTAPNTFGSGFTAVSLTAESVGNGWYRCVLIADSSTSTSLDGRVLAHANNDYNTFLGDGTSGIFAWGAQLEQAPFPSTYIPTTSASVTRNADALSVSLAALSGGGLSTTAGTILAIVVPLGWTGDQDGVRVWGICRDQDASVDMLMERAAANSVSIRRATGGNLNASATLTNGVPQSVAVTYDATNYTVYSSGIQRGQVATGGAFNAVTNLEIGHENATAANREFHGAVLLLYWPRALTTAEIRSLAIAAGTP